ncbi:MAG: hypothetical protein ACI9KE_004561, partial [Polyangiales bacterium]
MVSARRWGIPKLCEGHDRVLSTKSTLQIATNLRKTTDSFSAGKRVVRKAKGGLLAKRFVAELLPQLRRLARTQIAESVRQDLGDELTASLQVCVHLLERGFGVEVLQEGDVLLCENRREHRKRDKRLLRS